MNKFIAFSIAAAITVSGAIAKDIVVKGYTRKDGTKVKGYVKHVKDNDTDKAAAKNSAKKAETKTAETKSSDTKKNSDKKSSKKK